MAKAEIIQDEQGSWRVTGELSFASVPELERNAAGGLLAAPGPWYIDLGQVQRADSAGLAMLIEWARLARERSVEIGYRNMPAQMRAMARVSGLEAIIPLLD